MNLGPANPATSPHPSTPEALPVCLILVPTHDCWFSFHRGATTIDGAGFGIDRPAELSKEDDEYEAFRKRMMLAYRFRPNPLVRASLTAC